MKISSPSLFGLAEPLNRAPLAPIPAPTQEKITEATNRRYDPLKAKTPPSLRQLSEMAHEGSQSLAQTQSTEIHHPSATAVQTMGLHQQVTDPGKVREARIANVGRIFIGSVF